MTRLERAEAAARLRSEGKLVREIAAELGVSRSYASSLLLDPDGSADKKRKRRYGGSCVVCGAHTDGSNGSAAAPRYCHSHAAMNPEWRAKITVWTREIIVGRIQEWALLYGEPPAMPDWNPIKAREMRDEWRAQRFEADDRWPWFMTVVKRFGSWNAAVAAAGFEPRVHHGGGGNQWRRRQRMPKTHCKYGHEYSPENTYVWADRRYCRACNKRRSRESYLRAKARRELEYELPIAA